jgi:hypothetical protein
MLWAEMSDESANRSRLEEKRHRTEPYAMIMLQIPFLLEQDNDNENIYSNY